MMQPKASGVPERQSLPWRLWACSVASDATGVVAGHAASMVGLVPIRYFSGPWRTIRS